MVFMVKQKKKTDLNMVMKFQVFIHFFLLLHVFEVSLKRSKYVWWVLFKLESTGGETECFTFVI